MEPANADNQANNEIINYLLRGGVHGHQPPSSVVDVIRTNDMMQALREQQNNDSQPMPRSSPPYQHPMRQWSPEMREYFPRKV